MGHVQEDCSDSDDQNEGQYRVHNSNVVKVFLYCIIAIFCYPINQINNASVGVVEQLERYTGCIKCIEKILSDQDDP